MKHALIVIILAGVVAAQDRNKGVTADSKIQKVTVYSDRALVARTAEAKINGGITDISVDGLPYGLDDATLRVRVDNPLKLVSAEVKPYEVVEAALTEEKIQDLLKKKKELQAKIGGAADKISALEKSREFINSLQAAVGKESTGVKPSDNVDSWEKTLKFITSQLEEINGNIRKLQEQAQKDREALQVVENELARASVGKRVWKKRAVITVETKKDTAAKLEVSYVIAPAGWKPLYDVRVESTESETIEVSYSAYVSQRTGEDWENVEIELSTSQPSRSFDLPTLTPWVVQLAYDGRGGAGGTYGKKANAPAMAKEEKAARRKLEELSKDKADIDEALEAEAGFGPDIYTAVQQNVAAYGFKLLRRESVPADGSPRKVTVAILDLPSEFEYVAYPKMSKSAFIKAKLKNNKEFPLLAGPLNIFYENSFVGSTAFAGAAPNETYEVSVGLDDSIKVERKLVKKTEDRGTINKISYHYEFTVTNLKGSDVDVKVIEQIPVSQQNDIEVMVEDGTTKFEKKEKDGSIIWAQKLAKGKSATITLKYRVFVPGGVTIPGME